MDWFWDFGRSGAGGAGISIKIDGFGRGPGGWWRTAVCRLVYHFSFFPVFAGQSTVNGIGS